MTFVSKGRTVELAGLSNNPVKELMYRAAHLLSHGLGVKLVENPKSAPSEKTIRAGSLMQRRSAGLLARIVKDDPQIALVTSRFAFKPLPQSLRDTLNNGLEAIVAGRAFDAELVLKDLTESAFLKISGLKPEAFQALTSAGILKNSAGTYQLTDALAWRKFTESQNQSKNQIGSPSHTTFREIAE